MTRTNIINTALMRSAIRRFWPLMLAGLVALVLLLVVPVYTVAAEVLRSYDVASDKINAMHDFWRLADLGAWAYGVIAALVAAIAFGEHLFDSRAATFVGSLPERRPTVFTTYALTGLMALLAVTVVADVCMLPLALGQTAAFVSVVDVLSWLVLATIESFVFYAMATLACQLAGSRPVAALLYFVLILLAVCLELAIDALAPLLMYGIVADGLSFDFLSPVVWLGRLARRWMDISPVPSAQAAAYVAAGALALVGAGRLFCRRDLEVAGDSVAFARLRPILKYLAGISTALFFGAVYCRTQSLGFAARPPLSGGETVLLALLMAAGAFLGTLFSEMIMSRSAHVLSRCWAGGLALSVACAVAVGLCRVDVAHVARAVPDPTQVESVELDGGWMGKVVLTSSENVAKACDLQRDFIAYGGAGDRDQGFFNVGFTYRLAGGRTVNRSYLLIGVDTAALDDPGQNVEGTDEPTRLLARLAELADSPEGRTSRFGMAFDQTDKTSIQVEYLDDLDTYDTLYLTAAERADFVTTALRQDFMEGPAGNVFVGDYWHDDVYDANLQVLYYEGGGPVAETVVYQQLSDTLMPNTMTWLREHHPEIELRHRN